MSDLRDLDPPWHEGWCATARNQPCNCGADPMDAVIRKTKKRIKEAFDRPTALTSLLERIEKAEGPDRELDAEIMFDFFARPVGRKDDGGPSGYLWPEDNPSWSFGQRFPGKDRDWFKSVRAKNDGETLLIERDGALVLMNQLRIPQLTASLDASLALVEEMLPAEWPQFEVHARMVRGSRQWWHFYEITVPSREFQGWSRHAPLAMLQCLIRALIAQKETTDGK